MKTVNPSSLSVNSYVFNSAFFGKAACWVFCPTLDAAKALKSQIGGSGAILSVETVRAELAAAARYGTALTPHRQSLDDAIAQQDAGDCIPSDEDITIEEAAASLSISFAPAAFRVPVAESIPAAIVSKPARPVIPVGTECRVRKLAGTRAKVVQIATDGSLWVAVYAEQVSVNVTADEIELPRRRGTGHATWTTRRKAILARAFKNGSDD